MSEGYMARIKAGRFMLNEEETMEKLFRKGDEFVERCKEEYLERLGTIVKAGDDCIRLVLYLKDLEEVSAFLSTLAQISVDRTVKEYQEAQVTE